LRVLVVEDDERLGPEIVSLLRKGDYAVDLAATGEEAGFLGQTEPYDAIVLDLGLPDHDGLSILTELRTKGVLTPILVLTARDRFADLVAGFRAGADDYLKKPFHVDELMVRLEAFIAELLASQHDTERRRLLHRYLIWHLVRRIRSRNNGRPTTRQQSLMIRRLARGAVAFLDWLGAQNLTLGNCQQADLDRWLTDESATYREETGRLIRWAHANKLTTAHVASTRWNGPAQALDHQHRWEVTRRLLHDDHLKAEDRLAGLLVLLYAQGATAISRMTVGHIQVGADDVRLHLGRVPIQLPEPVATLARTVVSNRKGHATIGALTPSPWLFPGGQPGRPISSARLTHRLNNLGICPNQARSTALFQLATEIPAAILARTLGIHTDVAVIWQRHSAGDWATYAAHVSRRTSSQEH